MTTPTSQISITTSLHLKRRSSSTLVSLDPKEYLQFKGCQIQVRVREFKDNQVGLDQEYHQLAQVFQNHHLQEQVKSYMEVSASKSLGLIIRMLEATTSVDLVHRADRHHLSFRKTTTMKTLLA